MAAIGRFNTTNLVLSTLAASMLTCSSALATGGNHYGVTISKAPTENMKFANGVYSAIADGANLNVNDLTSALAAGNVEVTTGNGAGGDKMGDLHVDAGFTWASSTALTLDAYHSIFVTRAVVDAGTGALTLTNNDGGTGGVLMFGSSGNISIWNVANALTIDGQPYTLVSDIATLVTDVGQDPSGYYALSAASDGGSWTGAAVRTTFTGTFNGLGNKISNLGIYGRLIDVGLFANVGPGGVISSVVLVNAVVQTGGGDKRYYYCFGTVAGTNSGTVFNTFVSGQIIATERYGAVGGVVGCNSGVIHDSGASTSVSGGGGSMGGLVGEVKHGAVVDSYATGQVSTGQAWAGGLVGSTSWDAVVENCYAEGAVSTSAPLYSTTGGLIGLAYPSVAASSYSTGAVSGANVFVGGFLGDAETRAGDLSNDYWDTTTGGIAKKGCGNKVCRGVTGLTTQELQSGLPAGFDPTVWAENPNINGGFPYLIANPPPQ